MKIDNTSVVDLVKKFEGLRLNAYQDPVGIWTIGYGRSERGPNKPHPQPGMTIDKRTAEEWLLQDLNWFADQIRPLINVPLNDNQFAALVSFTYNVGVSAFARSTLLRKLNAGNIEDVPSEMMRWNKAGGVVLRGLTRRRAAESEMFLSPTAPKIADRDREEAHMQPDPERASLMWLVYAAGLVLAAIAGWIAGG